MVARYVLSPQRVVMSLPGVDALNPPAYTDQYLSMCSDWGPPVRPVQVGTLHAVKISDNHVVNFPAQPVPPAVWLCMSDAAGYYYDNAFIHTVYIGKNDWFTAFYCTITTSSFTILPTGHNASSYQDGPRAWTYVVWPLQ